MRPQGRPKGSTKNLDCLHDQNYRPNRLFNVINEKLGFQTDRQLADALDCMPGVISRMRNNKLPVSAQVIIGIQDLTGMALQEVLSLAGLPRPCAKGRKDEMERRIA
jgi:hypothetical protein